jgi:CDP-glycerol glycerophosphotransferase (TagB/SpsB family)
MPASRSRTRHRHDRRRVRRLEYVAAAALLRALGWLFDRLPIQRRVVLATARVPTLEGNLAWLHTAFGRLDPALPRVLLLEPYGYGLRAKLAYLLRVVRGMYYLRTSSLFIIDNAYLPIHVGPHRPRTTVVQVWHAVAALKRFGADTAAPLAEPERSFLHRRYDYVVCAGEASRTPYAAALRTPIERVLPLGVPRTDLFFDPTAVAAARARVVAAYPDLVGRRVITYAPTFRGRGRAKAAAAGLDASTVRASLAPTDVLVLKSHPNLDPALVPTHGFDVVVAPTMEINDLLAATDILITDYSSSIFEFALLRRPMLLLVADLDAYERDPGLYLDYRRDMIGTQVATTAELVEALRAATFDLSGYDKFIDRHLGGCDGNASDRVARRFMP